MDDRSASELQHILSLYEDCSGQIINNDKSLVMFSKNAKVADKQRLMQILEVRTEARNKKYLGLLVYMGRSKEKTFAYLKDNVEKNSRVEGKIVIEGWKRNLDQGVAQAVPSYAMSCFDLTKSLCDDLSTMICRFWWSQQEPENKMHWLSKEKLCTRKENGGLFFRDLHLFNLLC